MVLSNRHQLTAVQGCELSVIHIDSADSGFNRPMSSFSVTLLPVPLRPMMQQAVHAHVEGHVVQNMPSIERLGHALETDSLEQTYS
jgi:hypothetical protein